MVAVFCVLVIITASLHYITPYISTALPCYVKHDC